MIALVLGSLLTLALMGFFVYGNRSYRQDDTVSKLQEELRFGMSQITRDLEMAGFWSSVLDPAQITLDANLTLAGDCGVPTLPAATWVYDLVQGPITQANDATPAEANAVFPCISAAEFQIPTAGATVGNPDVVAIKRLASEVSYSVNEVGPDLLADGDAATPTAMRLNQVYVLSNGFAGIMFRNTDAVPAGAPVFPYEYWRYRPVVYFIRNYTDTPGDGVPSLCRKLLVVVAGTPTMTDVSSTECIATGIEDLQVEYGIDTDADAAPNYYVSDPDANQLSQLAAARITLLARSEQPDPHYETPKTYRLSADKQVAPGATPDGRRYYRRVLSTTVLMRNPAALGMLR